MFEITNPTPQRNHLRKNERAGQLRNSISLTEDSNQTDPTAYELK